MKSNYLLLYLISFLVMPTAFANLLIPELEASQKSFKESKSLCIGVPNLVKPLAAQGHPQALIALGDIYAACSKDNDTDKFKNLFELYGNAAILDSISSPSRSYANKKTIGRSWAYHRLWKTMHYGNDVKGYKPQNYVKEMHILAAAALYHGDKDLCWRAGGPWLESRGGCDAINQLANDYVYPTGQDGWRSPLKNKPLAGTMLQIHRANESNLNKGEVEKVFDFADKVTDTNQKLSGKVVCASNANLTGGIIALRQNLVQSPFFSQCRYQEWSGFSKSLKATNFNDYGLIVQLPNGEKGLLELQSLRDLAFDAANELGVDIRDIPKMDSFVDNLHTKIFQSAK